LRERRKVGNRVRVREREGARGGVRERGSEGEEGRYGRGMKEK
jgi:hypothetical protein